MKKFIITLALMMMITSAVSAGMTENIYASKMSIQNLTGKKVTDFWSTEYQESFTADKAMFMTQGAVELNDDGIKRRFWCHFDAKTGYLLRLKLDSVLLFSALGW